MKQILILFSLIIFSGNVFCQDLPVEDFWMYFEDENRKISDDGYVDVRDINNVLEPFTGTWTGSLNGKDFEIYITQYTGDYDVIKIDEIKLEFKITTISGGLVIIDTINEGDDLSDVDGGYMKEDGSYYFLSYAGEDVDCGEYGVVSIRLDENNPNQMFLQSFYDEVFYNHIYEGQPDPCPNGRTELLLPREGITLTKQ